jgi:hypothetical protein
MATAAADGATSIAAGAMLTEPVTV